MDQRQYQNPISGDFINETIIGMWNEFPRAWNLSYAAQHSEGSETIRGLAEKTVHFHSGNRVFFSNIAPDRITIGFGLCRPDDISHYYSL